MPSRITVAVCEPMAGVGGFMSEGTWFLAIYSCLRLSFHLGGAAVVAISLIGTMVF